MRVFEETFGIDKLLKEANRIKQKLSSTEYEPASGKYLMSDEDLLKVMQTLDEF